MFYGKIYSNCHIHDNRTDYEPLGGIMNFKNRLFSKKTTSTEVHEEATTSRHVPLMQIVIERHPNPCITTYHLDQRLTTSRLDVRFECNNGIVRPCPNYSNEGVLVEPFIFAMAERLYEIPGIVDNGSTNGVSFNSYEIRINKGMAFTDNKVEPQVLDVIMQSFGYAIDDIAIQLDDRRHEYQSNRSKSSLKASFLSQ